MSHRPGPNTASPRHPGHEQSRPAARLAPQAQRLQQAARESDYTLSHAGKRVRIGPITDQRIRPGEFRDLDAKEIAALKRAAK